jgi:hypothetical protein
MPFDVPQAPSQWYAVFEPQPIGADLRSPNYTKTETYSDDGAAVPGARSWAKDPLIASKWSISRGDAFVPLITKPGMLRFGPQTR